MGRLLSFVVVLTTFCFTSAYSAEPQISEEDCRKIEDGTILPKSLPADVLNQCAALLAAPVSTAFADAASDPCGATGTGGSIYCWGPWSVLAPAAGGGPAPNSLTDPIELDPRDLFAVNSAAEGPTEPPVEPPEPPALPLGGCAAGSSCGYATIIADSGSIASPDDTAMARFELSNDGTGFVVNAGEVSELQSTTLTPIYSDRSDGAEDMRSLGIDNPIDPAQVSQVLARVLRQNGTIELAADAWANTNLPDDPNSGFFAWGTAISQADIDALQAAETTLTFSGRMSVDNSTVSTISTTLGNNTWSGQWDNPNYTFNAGGRMDGASFGSDPSQFSNNVQAGYVEGALVGPASGRAVTHAVDVNLDGLGRIRDVGLALQNP